MSLDAVWIAALAVYIVGVVAGLAVLYEPLPARIGVALLWPIGPIAFIVTVTMLLLVVPIAFPRVGILLLSVMAVGVMTWLFFR